MVGVLSSEHAATAAASDVRRRSITQRELIPLMLTLKWRLWKRSYRKNIGKLIGTVFGALYGIGGLVGLAFLFLGTTLWSGEGEVFPLIIRGLGSVTVLLWLLIPVLASGSTTPWIRGPSHCSPAPPGSCSRACSPLRR